MHDQQTFASWLRQRRKALDLTQAQLAQQASCSLSAIRQFERGVLRPSRRLTEQLAEHLQIPPDLRIARPRPDDEAADIATLATIAGCSEEQLRRLFTDEPQVGADAGVGERPALCPFRLDRDEPLPF